MSDNLSAKEFFSKFTVNGTLVYIRTSMINSFFSMQYKVDGSTTTHIIYGPTNTTQAVDQTVDEVLKAVTNG